MKIGIDARSLQERELTGVGEYTKQIIKQLLEQGLQHEIRLFVSGAREPVLPDLGVARHSKAVIKRLGRPNKLISLSTILLERPQLDSQLGRLDVFFSPNFNFTALSPGCPHVLTVHDLSFEIFPEFFSTKRRVWHKAVRARQQARTASHIICDSHSTADDLSRIYKVSPEHISVIPLASSPGFRAVVSDARIKKVRSLFGLSERFILTMGTIEPRKNLISLLDAYQTYRDASSDQIELVIAGARGWRNGSFKRALDKNKYRKDIKLLGFIKSDQRVALYSAAATFVLTSSYEGFGLPALEAMSAKVPILAADTSSLPEVLGRAALLIDPERPAEIALGLRSILSDTNLRAELVARGLKRAQQFSWQQAGKQTLDVLTAVVANKTWELQNLGLAPRQQATTMEL